MILGIILGCANYTFASCKVSEQEREFIIKALNMQLMPVNNIIEEDSLVYTTKSFECVKQGLYLDAFKTIVDVVEKFPHSFLIQRQLVTLLGDYGQSIADVELKAKMISKSKQIFDALYAQIEIQPKRSVYSFKNEYFYRFGLYKEQYANGQEEVAFYWDTSIWHENAAWCYYGQGVGAANYARILFEHGKKQESLEWATKAIVSWSQHFMYENTYYNSYVHYAYALAIKECMQEAEAALKCSLKLLGKNNFDEYCEIKEAMEWIQKYCRG